MDKLIIFGFLSIPVIIFSWRTLFNVRSHGFYRFLSWECIIWLFASVYRLWFADPFSLAQVFSWAFLIISGYLVTAGVIMLHKAGKPRTERDDKNLYQFEKTSELVTTGIYRCIRHPLYASLLFLTWGIFLKGPDLTLTFIALASSVLLVITSVKDEKECIAYFGESYKEYMKHSKRFIPYII